MAAPLFLTKMHLGWPAARGNHSDTFGTATAILIWLEDLGNRSGRDIDIFLGRHASFSDEVLQTQFHDRPQRNAQSPVRVLVATEH